MDIDIIKSSNIVQINRFSISIYVLLEYTSNPFEFRILIELILSIGLFKAETKAINSFNTILSSFKEKYLC